MQQKQKLLMFDYSQCSVFLWRRSLGIDIIPQICNILVNEKKCKVIGAWLIHIKTDLRTDRKQAGRMAWYGRRWGSFALGFVGQRIFEFQVNPFEETAMESDIMLCISIAPLLLHAPFSISLRVSAKIWYISF